MNMFERLTQTAAVDRELLVLKDTAGDVFNTPREVDFTFETTEKESAKDFVDFVNGKSYGAAELSEVEPGHFRVLVLITMPINQNVINSVSGFMLCLSRLFRIDYLGWGSVNQISG